MKKKMERLALAGRLEVKLAEPGVETSEKTFSGYGAVFGNQDHASDIIAPGAFTKTLADHKANGTVPAMFFNHDAWSMPIGVWTELEEDDYGLKANGVFLDTAAGRDAYTAVKAGAVTGLSIGFWVVEFSMEGGVRTITEAKLMEISVVTFPCNEKARVADVKSDPEAEGDITEEDFMAKLAELGVDEEDAKALAAKRFKSDDEIEEADEKSDDSPSNEEEKSDEAPADEEEKDEDGEDEESEEASDTSDESEAKYMQTAIEAVNNLIRELKQENHGR